MHKIDVEMVKLGKATKTLVNEERWLTAVGKKKYIPFNWNWK